MSAEGMCATILATELINAARQDSEGAFASETLGWNVSNLLKNWAGQLSAANAPAEFQGNDAAVAAITYVLENRNEDPLAFLHYWFEGNFEALRRDWENVPDEVFIGADPLFKHKTSTAETSSPSCGRCEALTVDGCDNNGCGFLGAGNGAPGSPSADPISSTPSSSENTWPTADIVAAGLRAQSIAATQGLSPATSLSSAFKAMLQAGETSSNEPRPTITGNDLLVWYSLWQSQPAMLPPFVIGGMFQHLKQLLEEVGMLRQSHDEQLVLRVAAHRQIEVLLDRLKRGQDLRQKPTCEAPEYELAPYWTQESSRANNLDLFFGRVAVEVQAERLRLQEQLAGQELWDAGAEVAVQQLIFVAIGHLSKAVGDQSASTPPLTEASPKPSRAALIQGLAYALYAVDALDECSAPAPLDHLALENDLASLRREHTNTVTLSLEKYQSLVASGKQRELEVYGRVQQMAAYSEAPKFFHDWLDLMQRLAREAMEGHRLTGKNSK